MKIPRFVRLGEEGEESRLTAIAKSRKESCGNNLELGLFLLALVFLRCERLVWAW